MLGNCVEPQYCYTTTTKLYYYLETMSSSLEREEDKSTATLLDEVKEYYGEILRKTDDLKTNACCTMAVPSPAMLSYLSNVHSDVKAKYYGCGFVAPALLEGLHVLDLGCGAGRDCYLLAQMVGEAGSVTGVDMTSNMLDVAKATSEWHRDRFGYSKSNTAFELGYIERLGELPGLQNKHGSFDCIVSNCVVNLSPDKPSVFRSAHQMLKMGGELYFSDVYCSRRVPAALRSDPVLWGECLSGALYWNDFLRMARDCGFGDPRLVEWSPVTVQNVELEAKLAGYDFYSATYRLWKLPPNALESDCEDYGQAVVYKGTIPNEAHACCLDAHHLFVTGKVSLVCGNTYNMLHDTRYAPHFDFFGDTSTHFGIFEGCGKSSPFVTTKNKAGGGGSCAGGSCC